MKKIIVVFFVFICIAFGCISTEASNSSNFYFEDLDSKSKNPLKVIVQLSYERLDDSIFKFKIVEDIRKYNKEYYSNKNEEIIDLYNLDEFDFYHSSYSPFLFKTYDTYFDYQKDKSFYLSLLDSSSEVSSIYVGELNYETTDVIIEEFDIEDEISIEEAKEMIQVKTSSYTGSGVKIGIIDEGCPYDDNFPNGYEVLPNLSSTKYDHPTQVASILGGTKGIAPNAKLYFGSFYEVEASVEWMLEQGVNVINCSFGEVVGKGMYLGYSSYFDYIVRTNLITIVKSSGNDTVSKLVTNPGLGMNVLTVGSVNKMRHVSNFSSYKVDEQYENIILKPNVVAPGENINFYYNNKSVVNSGTSFSAPMVTGTLALLMEEFYILKIRPNLGISSLMSGASYLPGQTEVIDEASGAGLINYKATQELLKRNRYKIGTAYSKTVIGEEVLFDGFVLPARQDLKFFFMSLADSVITKYSGSITDLKYTKFKIEIYDDNDNLTHMELIEGNIWGFQYKNDTDFDLRFNYLVYTASEMVSDRTELFCSTYNFL